MELDPKFHNERAKSMEYRRLGKTDMKVSKIGIGAASFGKFVPLSWEILFFNKQKKKIVL